MTDGLDVIVVDDDPDVCELISTTVKRFYTWGRVISFTDSEKATTYCLERDIGVAIFVAFLPALIIGAVLIRRKLGLGYIIASIALIFMVLLTLALAAMVLVLVLRGINEDYTVALVFAALFITSVIFTLLLLRRVKVKRIP